MQNNQFLLTTHLFQLSPQNIYISMNFKASYITHPKQDKKAIKINPQLKLVEAIILSTVQREVNMPANQVSNGKNDKKDNYLEL